MLGQLHSEVASTLYTCAREGAHIRYKVYSQDYVAHSQDISNRPQLHQGWGDFLQSLLQSSFLPQPRTYPP